MSIDIQLPDDHLLKINDIIDTSRLSGDKLTDEDLKEFFLTIVQEFNEVRQAVNLKETGNYTLNEFVSGNRYFANTTVDVSIEDPQTNDLRTSLTQAYFTGALTNAGTTTIAHGIIFNAATTFVRIWGVANKMTAPSQKIPLPYINITGNGAPCDIELYVDNTNIYISPSGDATAFTQNYVFLEYLQQ